MLLSVIGVKPEGRSSLPKVPGTLDSGFRTPPAGIFAWESSVALVGSSHVPVLGGLS